MPPAPFSEYLHSLFIVHWRLPNHPRDQYRNLGRILRRQEECAGLPNQRAWVHTAASQAASGYASKAQRNSDHVVRRPPVTNMLRVNGQAYALSDQDPTQSLAAFLRGVGDKVGVDWAMWGPRGTDICCLGILQYHQKQGSKGSPFCPTCAPQSCKVACGTGACGSCTALCSAPGATGGVLGVGAGVAAARAWQEQGTRAVATSKSEARLLSSRPLPLHRVDHKYDGAGAPVTKSLAACLSPLGSLAGCTVTTATGLGNSRDGFHPIQGERPWRAGSFLEMRLPLLVSVLAGW